MTNLLEPLEQKKLSEDLTEYIKNQMKRPLSELPIAADRVAEVDLILDDYLEKTGDVPDNRIITLLTNYILADTLKDSNSSKTQTQEYPLQSGYSKRRAYKREVPFSEELLDFLHSKHQKRLDTLFKKNTANKEEV